MGEFQVSIQLNEQGPAMAVVLEHRLGLLRARPPLPPGPQHACQDTPALLAVTLTRALAMS